MRTDFKVSSLGDSMKESIYPISFNRKAVIPGYTVEQLLHLNPFWMAEQCHNDTTVAATRAATVALLEVRLSGHKASASFPPAEN